METITTTYTPAQAALAGSLVGATIAGSMIILLVYYILVVIATWKIFKKAGEPGWKAIIPIYNFYIMYKIVGMTGWFWLNFVVSIVASIIFSTQSFSLYTAPGAELVVYDFSAHPLVIVTLIVLFAITLTTAIINAIRTSKAFNHGAGFAVGLFFLQPIFWLILGFGSSKYNKKKALQK